MPIKPRERLIIGLIVAAGILLILAGGLLVSTGDILNDRPRNVTIAPHSTLTDVAEQLRAERIIAHATGFKILGRLLGVGNHLQAGTYSIAPSDTTFSILRKIASGKVTADSFTIVIPEGFSVYKIRKLLENQGIATDTWEFNRALVKQFPFLKEVPDGSLDGYLFPDTYQVARSEPAAALLTRMLSRFQSLVLPVVQPALTGKKRRPRFTLHEILTLASIVEKEAATPSERPVIASVYLNRLRIGMPLQADPTVKYVLEQPHPKVSLDDLNVRSPYNTYRHAGLPPGPICNPGLPSIRAVLTPAHTDYFYFVAKGDGTHVFSKTLQEHEKAKKEARSKP